MTGAAAAGKSSNPRSPRGSGEPGALSSIACCPRFPLTRERAKLVRPQQTISDHPCPIQLFSPS
ncbi:MAG: hypothetical protein OJF62_002708 [Pseudolabrys sp.]|nr:hypothetical protein [Pseudolabrys sp.]